MWIFALFLLKIVSFCGSEIMLITFPCKNKMNYFGRSYKTPLAKQNGGDYEFIIDADTGFSLPVEQVS